MLTQLMQGLYKQKHIRFDQKYRHTIDPVAILDIQRHVGQKIWEIDLEPDLAKLRQMEREKRNKDARTVDYDYEGIPLRCVIYYAPAEPNVGAGEEFYVEEILLPSGCSADGILTKKAWQSIESDLFEQRNKTEWD